MINYSYGPYNKSDDKEQWIRITEGCPHNCPYCYEPKEIKVFDIPEIVRNKVKIMDMNLLCKPEAYNIISKLSLKKVKGKVVYYEMICGIDYRFLDFEIACALKAARFKKIRIAWDWFYKDQFEIYKAIKLLVKAGYELNKIMIFMICNWKIPYTENCKKVDLCKIWNVQVSDCYFDNQVSPNIKPKHWDENQIKAFRKMVRKHNQLVSFKIDPEIKDRDQEEILF
jgi:organic radical activating enzyme